MLQPMLHVDPVKREREKAGADTIFESDLPPFIVRNVIVLEYILKWWTVQHPHPRLTSPYAEGLL